MTNVKSVRLQDHFSELTDPRRRKVTYPLINVVVIAVCAVISGADDFVAIAKFGRTKRDWFGKFLDLTNGIPSHDRFNAIFARIKPAEFEQCLLGWITSLHEITGGQVIAVDGKTLRGSFDQATGKSAIHMVSAWASQNHLCLGHLVVDAKSNEITAIPRLLEMIEFSGALVTIDAMGCQTEIAKQIVESGGDYCLAVKANQPKLQAGIEAFFLQHMGNDFADTKVRRFHSDEKGHGRQESRSYYLCPVPDDLPDQARWAGLKAIGVAVRQVQRDGKESSEVQYYILSKFVAARRFAEGSRNHWSVESMHWHLDVSFQEDLSRIRMGHADANFSILRRTALSLLKNESTARVGIKNKRLIAGWDDDYLLKVLLGA